MDKPGILIDGRFTERPEDGNSGSLSPVLLGRRRETPLLPFLPNAIRNEINQLETLPLSLLLKFLANFSDDLDQLKFRERPRDPSYGLRIIRQRIYREIRGAVRDDICGMFGILSYVQLDSHPKKVSLQICRDAIADVRNQIGIVFERRKAGHPPKFSRRTAHNEAVSAAMAKPPEGKKLIHLLPEEVREEIGKLELDEQVLLIFELIVLLKTINFMRENKSYESLGDALLKAKQGLVEGNYSIKSIPADRIRLLVDYLSLRTPRGGDEDPDSAALSLSARISHVKGAISPELLECLRTGLKPHEQDHLV